MNILVSGGAGFIGSHLTQALLGMGHTVTVLDDLSTGSQGNLPAGCELVVGDIRDRSCVDRCTRGQEVIFHQAAFTSVPLSMDRPQLCWDINVNGTRTLVESACSAGVRRFVFASTSAVYPEEPDEPRSEACLPQPKSPYASSKLETESLLAEFQQKRGLSYAALRYFNVYGPRQDEASDYAAVIPIFVSGCLKDKILTIYGDGSQTRDFVYVSDVVEANLRAMESKMCGIFNVGTARAVPVYDLAQTIIHLTSSTVGWSYAPAREGDVLSSTADIGLITSRLGWMPRWTLEAGLKETIAWFQRRAETSRV